MTAPAPATSTMREVRLGRPVDGPPRPLRRRRLRSIALVAAIALLASACTSTPQYPTVDPADRGPIPDSRISVQLFNFFSYVGFGESEEEQARQAQVLTALSDAGYTHVEPIDYTHFQGLTAQEYRALLDARGLQASSLHTSVTMSTTDEQWQATLDTAQTIGAPYVGAGSTPEDLTTREGWEAYADRIDQLGAMARERGMRYLVHLHDTEFAAVEGGESALDILVSRTDPANVTFELDLYWAVKAGEDPVALVRRYGDRIALLHVKDMAADGSITTAGDGVIDFAAVFAAAGDNVDFYVIERDPPLDDSSFDPFPPSIAGLRFLQTIQF
ncbi:sugar phosphate isomerase/epimerase [Demequina capsici]|uniref:Sugar phosphate isomerase/epimerase n=1 Tax=Demequina capsici TaxID=3075620 RepID=A0AA96FD69_9MICO|nr:sugar phosphate isomerase/epimerase [Demequina sp. PMTSA13]WNM27280.1 sugar phosphate isomerase/epimerase [Demequina sp. PMTSA13]